MKPRPNTLPSFAALLLLAAFAHAQSPVVTRPVATTPKPVVTTPVAVTPDWSRTLVGRWRTAKPVQDDETRIATYTEIEFRAGGTYVGYIVVQGLVDEKTKRPLRATPQETGSGRYAVQKPDARGFTLALQRNLKDPEADKANASESARIRVGDNNTLEAEDGSVLVRIK